MVSSCSWAGMVVIDNTTQSLPHLAEARGEVLVAVIIKNIIHSYNYSRDPVSPQSQHFV